MDVGDYVVLTILLRGRGRSRGAEIAARVYEVFTPHDRTLLRDVNLASPALKEEIHMATPERRGGTGGLTLGGIIVIIGIVLMFVWSIVGGLIVVLIGLLAFGGFARGRWY